MTADPDAFLRAFHAAHPGATSRAFSRGRDGEGRSSYELLAALAEPDQTILDLGCGDGYLLALIARRELANLRLLGLDMSAEELAAAHARPELATATLTEGRAQSLPLTDSSVDLVVSHLAFMLMSEIDTVCAEIGRVLRPGGRFATVTGGGPGDGDAFELFLELFREVYAKVSDKAPRYGDKRTRHGEGMAELFGDAFDSPTESSHLLRLDGDAERVWETLSSMYELFVIDDDALAGLHDRFVAAANELPSTTGLVPCTMRVRFIELRKR